MDIHHLRLKYIYTDNYNCATTRKITVIKDATTKVIRFSSLLNVGLLEREILKKSRSAF